jgi:hypothetical protein
MLAWQKVQSGSGWKFWKTSLGIVGTVRATELTHGKSGWHPHLHILLLSTAPSAQVEAARAWISEKWRACVVSVLGREHEPDDVHGCQITLAHSTEYLAKMGLEVAYSASKRSTGTSRSPWQILADAAAGDARSAELWRDYVSATKGRRQLEWSRGLKRRFGIEDVSDEDTAMRAARDESTEVVLELSKSEWNALRRANGVLRILELAEAGATPEALRAAFLRAIQAHERGST